MDRSSAPTRLRPCTTVWDVRKFGKGAKPLNSLVHGKTCQSAYFAPANSGGGGPRVLSTSYDNTLRIWSGVGAGGAECAAITIKHDNHTGRWVSPFRAVWAPAGDAVVCGSLKRATEVSDAAEAGVSTLQQRALRLCQRATGVRMQRSLSPASSDRSEPAVSPSLHLHDALY